MKIHKAIVTGGAGFIGSHIVDELLARNIETFVIDNLSSGFLNNLLQHKSNDLLHLFIDDIKNINNILKEMDTVDILFHQAAIVSVPKSITHPLLVHDINVNATLGLLDFCIKKNVKKFIFASSAAVYGDINKELIEEDTIGSPLSPYGASKLSIENYLHAYHSSYGIQPVVLRYFNVYGQRQSYGNYSGVITNFINNLLNKDQVLIYGDGKQVRDFVHVQDIVQANMLAMESADAIGKVFNVGSGSRTEIYYLLEIVKELTNTKYIENKVMPARTGDIRSAAASIEKIQKLGYSPRISLRTGLEATINYFRSRQIRLSA